MKRLLAFALRIAYAAATLFVAPVLAAFAALAIAVSDLLQAKTPAPQSPDERPRTDSATIVIPNWNGRELLAKYLPTVVEAAAGNPANEVIVVDNGSTDGSAEFVRGTFPSVTVLALEMNLGFGGGCNAGVRAARNDVVVLLNSDMRVEPGFLAPLLDAFTDERVFAAACQIFFSDPNKIREETGLTQGWWRRGALRVRHRADDAVTGPYPCFYGGGGSCAFDRRKFLELGGFDELLAPFYFEDTDLGYMAWKRGWKVLYQPHSVVWHEHRGTIGRRYSNAYIQAVLKTNLLLFCWKNIHEWPRLAGHFLHALAGVVASAAFGDSPERTNLPGLWRATLRIGPALRSRRRARSLAVISDSEAFRRPLGGFFRDRFSAVSDPSPMRVLFVSPYPVCPPIHGGAVFMYNTIVELANRCELHLVIVLDHAEQRAAHGEMEKLAASVEYFIRRRTGDREAPLLLPHAVREIAHQDLEWIIHRQMFANDIDVLQLEYTSMAQYGGDYRWIACCLFEHDIYFQSVARSIGSAPGKLKPIYEYLRALRYELTALPHFDRVQVCSEANAAYLRSFAPRVAGLLDAKTRAGIHVDEYCYTDAGREPFTMLFLGSFRHAPNIRGFEWFVARALPRVLTTRTEARVIAVGSEMPSQLLAGHPQQVELRGYVPDIREPLSRYAVFICPVLSGSGMRVKLLEAFAAGIPVVSTAIGAEGLSAKDGEFCRIADQPDRFARAILELFDNPAQAAEMAARARAFVERERDSHAMTELLAGSYRTVLKQKRSS